MKMFVMHRKITLSIFIVLLMCVVSGVSYALDAPNLKSGVDETRLTWSFSDSFQPLETKTYGVEARRKTPQGDWDRVCIPISNDQPRALTATVTLWISGLEPGTTYQVRYRDNNQSVCTNNPPNPGPWSAIGEGTTSGNAPNAGQPGGTTYSVGEEILTLPTGFWTPDASYVGSSFSIIGGKVTLLLSNDGGIRKEGITYTCVAASGCKIEGRRVTRGTIQATGGGTPPQPTPPIVSGPEVLVVDPDAPPIYWTDWSANSIRRVNLDGSNVQDLIPGLPSPRNIALDVAGGKMYWTDTGTDKIQRANLDGSNVEDLVTRGLDNPNGIALDVSGGKMYWTDIGTDKIQRANLDGSNVEDLVTRGLDKPNGIALDVVGGKMYWTGIGTDKIQRANLDGSNVEDLITQGLKVPVGIALDVSGGKMYWTDGVTEKIQRANLDGSTVKDLITHGLDSPWGIALDIPNGKMYWTHMDWNSTTEEWTNGKIQRANLDGSDVEDIVTGLDEIEGIALGIPALQQPTPQPDLVLEAVRAVPATVAPGETFRLYATLKNQGTAESTATKVRYYRSTNNVISTADTQLGSANRNPLAPNATIRRYLTVTAPTTPGTYYYGVCVDNVTNESDTANNCSTAVNVTVTAPPVVAEDVNTDGVVDVQDLVYVAQRYGQTGTNSADVNGDDVVNIDDLILVAAVLDADAAAAPSLNPAALEGLTVADVKVWLSQARQRDLTDPSVQSGILFLEQLLASMVPKETLLLANYPNPFNPETWIPYQLSEPAAVMITIYAANGHVIRQLALGHQSAGVYQSRNRAAYWDGRNAVGEPVASGVYFYTLTAGDFSATRKMLIRK